MQSICKFNSRQKSALQTYWKNRNNPWPGKLSQIPPKQALYPIKVNLAFCTKAGFHPMGGYFPFFGRPRQQAEHPVHLSYSSSRNNDLMTIYRNILRIIISLIPNNLNNSTNTSPTGS
jgi:hypothetical protein